jgi:lipopolysaccharide export system permease protein
LQEAVSRNLSGIHETLRNDLIRLKTFAFKPIDLVERREIKQMMTTPELNAFINKEKQKGSQSLNEYLVEFHRRTASPFSAFVLSIIGACIASRKVRGGSGVHLAVGLMISAVYIFLMQFSTTFSLKGNLHPLIAVWIPNFLFGILALFIYRKYSK